MVRLLSVIVLSLAVAMSCTAGDAASATRHRIYVGTITRISSGALTIHSKSHAADYTFQINQSTRFLQRGLPVSRDHFKVGSYVTVSYSTGNKGVLLAYHISMRK